MPPLQKTVCWSLEESDTVLEDKGVIPVLPRSVTKRDEEVRIVWSNVFFVIAGHFFFCLGGYVFFTEAMWTTWVFTLVWYLMSTLGITVGAHRLWSHKSFKARLPLRILLVMFFCCSGQGHLLKWIRDHRIHHKFSDTDADPTNSTRGFFFAHMGWLLVRKHPELKAKADTISHDDLYSDALLQFQKKYFVIVMPLFCFVLPTLLPSLWGESLTTALLVSVFRFAFLFHVTSLVNSVAHLWGDKPYDKNMQGGQIIPLSFLALGEGFHNFHHVFPWDYKTGELGGYSLNISKLFIDSMAKIGWAYDMKSVSPEIVARRVKRTGDGSHHVWGWDDAAADDKTEATIDHPVKAE